MIGKKHSEKTKQKMSESHFGKKMSEEAKRNMSKGKRGYTVSERTREKISKAGKGHIVSKRTRKKLSGRNHWNWKGGITPKNERIRRAIEFRLWREAVFARDNWTCQKCKIRCIGLRDISGRNSNKLIQCHHIKNFSKYPELGTSIENGITLCKKCHDDFHKQYGYINNNRRQLERFLKQF